jgi:L-malate glycosyltransferase
MYRILYFSRDFTVHDRRFLTALARTEHQVYFLRLEKGANALDENLLPPEIQLVDWAGGKEAYHDEQRSQRLADLKRVIKQVKPDLIQAGPLHLSAYLAARSGFQPLVSMSWGYDLLYDAKRSPQVRRAIRYTLAHSAAMVGDCNTIRQLVASYGMPNERIVTFPWGIDLEHFRPAAKTLNFQPSTFNLLSTRAWEPIYGVDVIVRAFAQAAKIRPELCLVMLGGGTQAALVRQILQDGGVLDKVQFPGWVGEDELPRFYQEADLYLSATHSDGASISLLEALACGTPVVVSDIPGNREWVEPGVQGWRFPDGDAEALARCILNGFDQRDHLPEMRRAARILAEQRADWKRNFPELFKAYQIALNVDDL